MKLVRYLTLEPPRRVGRPTRTSWAPCARCGEPDGAPGPGMQTPLRADGRPFGIAGRICVRCYFQLRYRQRHPGRHFDPETVAELRAGLEGLRRIVTWINEDDGKRRFERASWWRQEAGRVIDAMEREVSALAPEAAV